MKYSVSTAIFSAALISLSAQAIEANDWSLKVSGGVSWTDNRDNVDADLKYIDQYGNTVSPYKKTSQTRFYIGPTLSFTKTVDERLNFRASVNPYMSYYNKVKKNDNKNEYRVGASLDFNYRLSPRQTVSIRDRYSWSGSRGWDFDYDYNPTRDERESDDYWTNTVEVQDTYFLSPQTYMKVSYSNKIKRYDREKYARYKDTDTNTIRLDVMKIESKYLTWGGYGSYTDYTRNSVTVNPAGGTTLGDKKPNIGYKSLAFGGQVVADFEGNQQHLVYVSAGFQNINYRQSGVPSRAIPTGSVEFRLWQQERANLLFGLRYSTQSADLYPYSSKDELSAYMQVNSYWLDDRRLNVSVAVEARNRANKARNDLNPGTYWYQYFDGLGKSTLHRDSYYFRLGAQYSLLNGDSINAYYTWQKVNSDYSMDYVENMLGLAYSHTFF